jgi:hypothetical protein
MNHPIRLCLALACLVLPWPVLNCSSQSVAAPNGDSNVASSRNELDAPLPSKQQKLGVYRSGRFYLDADGDGSWDPARDRVVDLGIAGRPYVSRGERNLPDGVGVLVNGQWYAEGQPLIAWGVPASDAYPVPGAWGWAEEGAKATFRRGLWTFAHPADAGSQYAWTISFGQRWDIPVVGDFREPLSANEEFRIGAGVFRSGTWYFSPNEDGGVVRELHYGRDADRPAVADWVGDGKSHLGVFRDGEWIVDSNGNNKEDSNDRHFYFGIAGDTPLVGAWANPN